MRVSFIHGWLVVLGESPGVVLGEFRHLVSVSPGVVSTRDG